MRTALERAGNIDTAVAYRKNDVRHVTLLSDDLQPCYGVHVAHDVANERWAVLLHLNSASSILDYTWSC